MKIACVITTLAMGGAERLALDLAHRMVQRGHHVQVLVLGEAEPKEWPTELPVLRLGITRNPLRALAGFWKARRALREFAPDIVHSHCFYSNLFARLLRLCGVRARLLSTVHNVYEGPWLRMLAYRLTDWLADGVVFVCQAGAERYTALHAAGQAKIRVLANGIDLALFAPDPERRAATRTAMEAGECFVWLSAGRLTGAKDIPNLLRAFARVLEAREDAALWIAGEDRDGEQSELQALAADMGIAFAVCWLGLRRDLPALIDACDGFVLASAWEGMPLVIAEAMAMSTPVVATDVGGVREVAGESAWLVTARDSAALAQAMLAVMRLPEDSLRTRTARGRARMEAGFSMEACADRWEALYRELLERPA
jgi:glycosyltransferase involved in cell wall biosynthesis